MGIIEFTCQACSWNWKGHMSFCPKCGSNPMKAPMSMAQLLNAPYDVARTKVTTVRQMAQK